MQKVQTGAEFNAKYLDAKFVKLTTAAECEFNGAKLKDGLNIGSEPTSFGRGGIMFIFLNKMQTSWFLQRDEPYLWSRNVIIPDDAKVYEEFSCIRVDKLILEPRKAIVATEDISNIIINQIWSNWYYIYKNHTYHKDLNLLHLVEYSPKLLYYIENQTEQMCLIAVDVDPMSLKYVKTQTKKICEEAIKKNPLVKKYVRIPLE